METREEYLDGVCAIKELLYIEDIERYIDYCAIYSKKHWLIFIEERLRRLEDLE